MPFEDLPPEIVLRVASFLTSCKEDVYSLARPSMINKSTYECLKGGHQIWYEAYKRYWEFNDAGLRGQTADIFNHAKPKISHGKEMPIKPATAREDFYNRQTIDLVVRAKLRETIYIGADRMDALLEICTYGTDVADVFYDLRNRAHTKKDFEVIYWCTQILQTLSAQVGDRMLQQIQLRPKVAPWDTGFGVPEALDTLFAANTYYQERGTTFYFNIDELIESRAAMVYQYWEHRDGCTYEEDVNARCTCLKSSREAFEAVLDVLETCGLTDIASEDFYNVENSFLYGALWEQKPAIPIVLTIIFCAVATELGLACWPVGYPAQVLAAIVIADGDSDEIKYFSPYEHGRTYSGEQLVEALHQNNGMTRGEALHHLGLFQGSDIAIRTSRNILNCLQRGSGPPDKKALLAALKLLHWSKQPMPVSPSQFALLLSAEESLSCNTWVNQLDEIARLGGHGEDSISEAKKVFKTVMMSQNRSVEKARRHRPDVVLRYSYGTIIHHKKHNYQGVIYGLSDFCNQPDSWKEQMRVDKLQGGADQPFYQILATDGSDRYVAEVNIEAISCLGCSDRQAGPRDDSNINPGSDAQIDLLSVCKQLEELPAFGNLFRTYKAGRHGFCGYLPSREMENVFRPSLWPPHPNACPMAEHVVDTDDYMFGPNSFV